ncbi:hypothetical protein ACJX0J_024279, partial [Zea mays]
VRIYGNYFDMDPVNPNSHRKRNYNNACYAPSTLSHAEARRIRKRVLDQRKLALAGSSMPSQHTPTLQCGHFDPDFVKTIKGGKVRIPAYRPRPEPLLSLARFDGDVVSKTFMQNIRQYNCLFAFTSMGAHIDRSLNDGRGPPVFKVCGQIHHRIGSLLPMTDQPPKFLQLYVYDTSHEVNNRIRSLSSDDAPDSPIQPQIVNELLQMLDTHNPFAKKFRIAKKRLTEHANEEFIIRIIGAKEGDPVQYDMPTTDDLAMLVIGDFSLETFKRDIIIETRNSELKRISSLHPAYMALQYPLLFPYGERGFQVGVMYSGIQNKQPNSRIHMTMQDYYCYQFHYKPGQPNPFLSYGILSNQAKVDARACIDENRLTYILNNQDKLRIENLQELDPKSTNAAIRVRIIRKWEFRGATNDGPLRHVNLILADEQGTAIHAEIQAALVADKGSLIQIDKVYELKRFRVAPSRNYYKPVDNSMMIQFTLYTQAKLVQDPPPTFPRYAYKLTSFENIGNNVDNKTYLIDVLGILTEIGSLHHVGYNNSNIIRDIFLKDINNTSTKVTLWGHQASSFSVDNNCDENDNKPVVVLFVGCLAKRFKGEAYLSATAACTWYFNPDIPEAQVYYSNNKVSNALSLYHASYKMVDGGSHPVSSATSLHPRHLLGTNVHRAMGQKLSSARRYKLSFIATDGTSEAEFFCFDTIAKRIVGKSCQTLFSTSDVSRGPPPDLAAIVSLKFTFAVTINMSAFSVTNRVFSILSVLTNHGRQASIPCATENLSQQQMLTQDNILDVITTQESPATSFAKLSTSTKQENVPRRRLTYSEMLQDTNVDEQVSAELNKDSLASPPKKY